MKCFLSLFIKGDTKASLRLNYLDRNKTAQGKQGLAEGQPLGADHQNNLGASEKPKFLGLASENARILEEQSGVTR